MRIPRFDPPGFVDDLAGDPLSEGAWNQELSDHFTAGATRLRLFHAQLGIGVSQFYNPLTEELSDEDVLQDITWNGFPKRFTSTTPGQPNNYAAAEPTPLPTGRARPQDEYLEWHVVRNAAGKITSIQFTCEGWDYWEFLGRHRPQKVLELYQKYISPDVRPEDLFDGEQYNRLNKWNTSHGAMHLTHGANNLGAEIRLAAEATVRRKGPSGAELTASIPLIRCGLYGAENRNSDPKIGVDVNALARAGFLLTLQNPVGLYIADFRENGLLLPNGEPARGFFHIVRGTPDRIVRAEFRPPAELEEQGITVSDVRVGSQNIRFGGEIAARITMKIPAAACRPGSIENGLAPCGPVPELDELQGAAPAGVAAREAVVVPVRVPSRATEDPDA